MAIESRQVCMFICSRSEQEVFEVLLIQCAGNVLIESKDIMMHAQSHVILHCTILIPSAHIDMSMHKSKVKCAHMIVHYTKLTQCKTK